MKKIMALCLAMMMALSMVSFSVMAEGEAVLFEAISNGQIPEFITGNLTFPEGATVTSTKEAVIALDGTVTRPLFDVEEVTLTVNGTSFDVKVQPQTIVGVSEIVTFEDYNLENGAAIGADQGWTIATSSAGTFAAEYVVDGTNSYAKLGFTNKDGDTSAPATGNAFVYTMNNAPGIQNARYYVMKAKVYAPVKATTHSGLNMNISWGGVKAGEFMLGSAGWAGKVYGGALLTGNPWHTRATAVNNTRNKNVPGTGFVDLTIRIDKELGKVEYYQDGLLTEHVTYDASKTYVPDFTSDKAVKVTFPFRVTTAHIFVDDIYVYAESTADGVIGSLPDQERADYYKNLVLANQLTSNGKYVSIDSDLNLVASPAEAANVTIAYESSDTSAITDDGKVTPVNSLFPKNVTFTATITAGEVVETVTYYLQVAQAGTTYVSATDFEAKAGEAGYITDENTARGTVLYKNAPEGSGTLYAYSGVGGGGFADRMLISADVKYSHDKDVSSNYGGIQVTGIQGADSCSVLFNFNSKQIGFGTTKSVANESGSGLRSNDIDTLWLPMPKFLQDKDGEWMNVVFDFNIMSQTYEAYVDGTLVTPHPLVRRNAYKTDTTSSTVRGVNTVTSAAGDIWLDNVSLRKYTDANVAEVNAALNAAAVLYASDVIHPALTNRALAEKTISKSWINNNADFYKDETDVHNNPARYTLQTDGPSITYKINNETVTAIDVDAPQTVEFTITATSADGAVTESKTFTKKLAPVSIRDLGLNGRSAFNGLWLEGVTGNEKVVVAQYFDGKLILVKTISLADNENFVADTGLLKNMSVQHPYSNTGVDQVKIFVIGADGISPVAFMNDELRD